MDVIDLNSLLIEPFKIYDLDGYSSTFIKELLQKNETVLIIQCSDPDEELLQLLKKDGEYLFRLPVCPITQDHIKFIVLITPMGKFYDYMSIKHRIENNKFECPFTRNVYDYKDLVIVKINSIKELRFYFELINTYDRNTNGTFKEYKGSKMKRVYVGSMEELKNVIELNIKSPVIIKCTKNFTYDEQQILRMIQNMYVVSLTIYFNESSSVFFTDKLSELKLLYLICSGDLKMNELSSYTFPKNLVLFKITSDKEWDE